MKRNIRLKALSRLSIFLIGSISSLFGELSIEPASVLRSLESGNRETVIITLTNTGLSPVEWTAEIIQDMDEDFLASMGVGSDQFGYRWSDSNDPDGPPFKWTDISSFGNNLLLGDDDFQTVTLPFPFVFYGTENETVSISSNGYLTFGLDGSDHTNDPIPSTREPNAIIAPFWADLDPTASGSITTFHDPAKSQFIIQYSDIQKFSGSDNYSFQVILDASGDIYFYYQVDTEIGTLADDITIGIENDNGDIGSSVANNSNYASSGTAVHFATPTWMNLSPVFGHLEAGESINLNLTLNAGALNEGSRKGTVSFASASGDTIELPIDLEVSGTPKVSLEPQNLSFEATGIGGTNFRTIYIQNFGSAPLVIDQIQFTKPDFGTQTTLPIIVDPASSLPLIISFSPLSEGNFGEAATLQTNDPLNPTLSINLIGEGLLPADIEISPLSFSVTLLAGDKTQRNLQIENMGVADLVWESILNGDVSNTPNQASADSSPKPSSSEEHPRVPPDFSKAFSPTRVIVRLKESSLKNSLSLMEASGKSMEISNRRKLKHLHHLEIWELAPFVSAKQLAGVNNKSSAPTNKIQDLVEWLNAQPDVLYAEPDYLIQLDPIESIPTVSPLERTINGEFPQDPSFGLLWGLNNSGQDGGSEDADIDAPEAWLLQSSAEDVIVGVIDTGVDYLHEDLASNMWKNPGEIPDNGLDDDGNGYVDDIYGWDWANNDRDPIDDHNHGSHVAGTIAAVGDNGIGISGVSWKTRIMALKFLDKGGSGYLSGALEAIDYAVENGAQITNNSWGGGGFSQAMLDSIQAAGEQDLLFIAAAGNDGLNADSAPAFPAAYDYPSIISVAATTRNDTLAYFSNYGATSVDLGAPGHEIFSTKKENTYGYFSGTSMATPHVSGAAAIILGRNHLLTAQQVKQILIDSSDPLEELSGKTLSGGRLNLRNAIALITPPWFFLDPSEGTIAPDENTLARLNFDAAFLPEGLSQGSVSIFSNDPDEPFLTIPVELTVEGAPAISTDTLDLDFGNVFLHGNQSLDLVIHNSGTQALTVNSASTEEPFSYTGSLPVLLNPSEVTVLRVQISGIHLGTLTGQIEVQSTDPTDPILTIGLSGVCIEPPIISVIENRMDATLTSGDEEIKILTLANTGANDLEYSFSNNSPDWLRVTPIAGVIKPGMTGDVQFHFNAQGLAESQLAVGMMLNSNDPLRMNQSLLIVLNVSDGPALELTPTEINFDDVFIHHPKQLSLTLKNKGNQILNISSMELTGSGFSLLSDLPQPILPGNSSTLLIKADPSQLGNSNGELTIRSNLPGSSKVFVPIFMNAINPPVIATHPESFNFNLNEGNASNDFLDIANSGLDTLNLSLEILADGTNLNFAQILQQTNLTEITGDDEVTSAEFIDNRFYVSGANRGLNIPQIYVLDKEGNFLSQFSLPGVSPGNFGAYDLAWDGQFLYGAYSHGIVKFDTEGNFIGKMPKPEEFSSVVGIAHDPTTDNFWIDGYVGDLLEIDRQGNILRRFSHDLERSFGLAWDNATKGGPFLWVFEQNELMTRKIHQFDPVAGEFTGLTLVVNSGKGWAAGLSFTTEWQQGQATLIAVAREVDSHLSVVNLEDVQNWLTLSPLEASIGAGENLSVIVSANAEGIWGGEHRALIHLSSNDPETPFIEFPATLSVTGIPAVELPASEVVFEQPVFTGGIGYSGYRIRNSGTDTLLISGISISGTGFSIKETSGFSLSPQESKELILNYEPVSVGVSQGLLTIMSNAPDQSTINIPLKAEGIPAPVLNLDNTLVSLDLHAGQEIIFPLTIGNSGGSQLEWQVSPHDSVYITQTLQQSPAKIIPSEGKASDLDFIPSDFQAFSAQIESTPKTIPYSEGFEDGRFVDSWYKAFTTSKTEVSNASAGEGNYSFHAYGSTQNKHFSAIYQVFEPCQPDYLSFRIRSDSLDRANAFVSLNDATAPAQDVVFFFSSQTGLWSQTENPGGNISIPCEQGQWYHVECRDIDWSSRTFDYYMDGELIQKEIPFGSKDSMEVRRLDLYNYHSDSSAWWDDILLSNNTAEWMKIRSSAGSTLPSKEFTTQVTASAAYLQEGSYSGFIILRSNDPATPQKSIPIELNVESSPGLYLPRKSIHFRDAEQHSVVTRNLILSNSGTEPLSISEILFSDTAFGSFQLLPLILQPGERYALPVRFSPDEIGPFEASLSFVSNCPYLLPDVLLSGIGISPPGLSVDTTPISISIPAGQNSTGALQLENMGVGNLNVQLLFETEAVKGGGSLPSQVNAHTAGGPDNFGYTFRDERDGDGPMFQWQEIATPEGGNGIEITNLTGFTASRKTTENDDAYAWPTTLEFDFPFYGQLYDTLAIGAYGVVYFENDGFGWFMDTLPTNNVAQNRGTNTFIATYNTNLDIRPGAIYVSTESDRTIIEHYKVTSFFQEWAIFQTILYPNGDIRMQWKETGPWLKGDGSTIGIQGDTTTALMYAHWDSVVEDGRCIYFTYPGNPYRDWLRSTVQSLTIASGKNATVPYTIKAEYLLPGQYKGSIVLNSNDTSNPLINIPVVLTVTDPAESVFAMIRNQTALVVEGESVVLTQNNLLASSPIAGPSAIIYHVNSTGDGSCLVNGIAASTFTQEDLAQGRVAYSHDGSDERLVTSLGFTVADGVDSIGPIGLRIQLSAVNDPPTLEGPLGYSAVNGLAEFMDGIILNDPDISQIYSNWFLSLKVNHGSIFMESIPDGVYFGGIGSVENNGSSHVTVETWLSRLQANFNTQGAIHYTANPGFKGSDILTITVNDNGNTGNGPAHETILEIPIKVYPDDYSRWRSDSFGETAASDPALEQSLWGDFANPDHDRYSNISEYLFSGNPLAFDASPLIETGFDGVHLWMRYNLRKNLAPMTIQAEWTTSPHDEWSTSSIITNLLDSSEKYDFNEVKVPMIDEKSKFLRLRISNQ